jgi:exonuclease III
MVGVNSYLSMTTLNVNEINSSMERYRMINWIKIQKSTMCCLQEIHFTYKDIDWKCMNNDIPQKWKWKESKSSILISDTINFKSKTTKREKVII